MTTQRQPDSLGFYAAAERVPESTEIAVLAAQDAALPDGQGVGSVVLTGAGPGKWAAEVVAAISAPAAKVPIVVANEGEVPAFADESTLVVHVDSSIVHVGDIPVPLGLDVPHPRAALGALCAAPLTVLGRLGLVDGVEDALDRAIAQLHHRRAELFRDGTPSTEGADPVRLARRIGRLLPLVYGEGAVGGLAAKRWKQQCNANGKVPAFSAALPDLAYDEIAGWGQHGDLTRQVFVGVVLRHDHEAPGREARFATLTAVLEESLAAVHPVVAAGDGPLAQLLDLAYLGDVLSLHLATKEGLDPGPAPALGLLAGQ
jgi:hypothetical protein